MPICFNPEILLPMIYPANTVTQLFKDECPSMFKAKLVTANTANNPHGQPIQQNPCKLKQTQTREYCSI